MRVISIKKDSYEHRIWLKHRNEKKLKLRTKKKEYKKSKLRRQNEYNRLIKLSDNYNNSTSKFEFSAPHCFSLIKNAEETTRFFNLIIKFISNKKNYGKQIFIDISQIEELSTDALMYLLAIVNNLNENFKNKYSFSGNAPMNRNIKKKFTESGFYNFVSYQGHEPLTTNKDNLQIVSGSNCDTALAKRISDFAKEKANVPVYYCSFLYNMMIELMSNVHKHAYNSSLLLPHWYCYAEYENNSIYFTFMDTGVGIPSTVRKRVMENLDLLNIKEEYKYVTSALDGELH